MSLTMLFYQFIPQKYSLLKQCINTILLEKTMYTVFGCHDCSQAKINLAGNVVKQVSNCKYVGVYIDQDMK